VYYVYYVYCVYDVYYVYYVLSLCYYDISGITELQHDGVLADLGSRGEDVPADLGQHDGGDHPQRQSVRQPQVQHPRPQGELRYSYYTDITKIVSTPIYIYI